MEFELKTRLISGAGEAANLGKYLKELSLEKVGVIIDSAISKLGYAQEVLKNIQETAGSVTAWEYDLKAEPDYDSLDRIKAEFIENDEPLVDCFVGIGGGSVMDFAKGLATLLTNSGPAIDFRGFPEGINPSLPMIAVPTTAGTGSDVTYNAVFTDKNSQKKLGINTKNNFPILAVLDPKLTLTCPKSVTVSSGMDALVHTLESYTCTKANGLTKMFAREAFKLIFNNLSKVLDDPENLEIRGNLQLGAYLAGISLMNAGSGPSGALSYTLGVHFKVPHGIAGGVFIPHIMKHNVDRGYDYSELYELIEGADTSLSTEEKSKEFSKKLFELCEKLEVPKTLTGFGVTKDNTDQLFKDIDNYGPAFAQNPVPFSVDDGKNLVTSMI